MKKKFINKKTIIVGLLIIGLSVGIIQFLFPSQAGNDPVDNNGLKTTTLKTPTSGVPSDYTNLENLFMAAYVIENAKSFEAHTEGSSKGVSLGIKVNQSVNDSRNKQGDYIFTEALSYSNMKAIAEQRFFTPSQVLVRNGKCTNSTSATWKDTVSSLTYDEFDLEYRALPDSIHKYILTEDTVLESSYVGKTDAGYYEYKYEIDTTVGPSNFAYEVKHMANSSIYPTFKYCRITLIINDKWEPISIRTEDNYNVKTMGLNADCTTDLTEYFDSINDDNVLPEQEFFENFISGDGVITDGKEELDATEYLAYAFSKYLTSKSNFDLNIKYNNLEIPANLQMDIPNMVFKIKIGDYAFIEYSNGLLYIMSDQFSGFIDTNKLTNSIPSNQEPIAFDLDSLLANATVEDDDKNITLTLPIDMFGIKANAIFKMHHSDDAIVLDNLYGEIYIQDQIIKIDFNPSTSSQIYPSTSNITNDLSGISNLITPIMNLISGESIKANISYAQNDMEITGQALIDFNGLVKFDLNITYKDFSQNLNFYILDNYAYVSINNIDVKMSITELLSYFDSSSLDLNLENLLLDINYQNGLNIIIKNLLNNDISLSIKENNERLELTSNNLTITLAPSEESISLDDKNYLDLTNKLPIQELKDIIENKKVCIDINEFTISNMVISGSIFIDFTSTLKLKALININDQLLTLIIKDNQFYLSYMDYSIDGNISDLSNLTSLLSKLDFNGTIPNIALEETDGINILIDSILNINISSLNNIITIFESNYDLSLDIYTTDFIISDPSKAKIHYEDIKPIINKLLTLYSKDFIEINLAETKINLKDMQIVYSGLITFDTKNIIAEGNINLKIITLEKTIDLKNIIFAYENGTVYLQYENVKIKGSILDISKILSDFSESLLIPDISINYYNGLNIFIENIPLFNDLKLVVSSTDTSVNITSDVLNAIIQEGTSFTTISKEGYENINSLEELINIAKDIVDAKAFIIKDINAIINISSTTIEIYDSYLKYDFNNYLEGQFKIKVQGTIHIFNIMSKDGIYYISYGDFLGFQFTISELNELITLINETFELNTSFDLALSLEKLLLAPTINLVLGINDTMIDTTITTTDVINVSLENMNFNSISINEVNFTIDSIDRFTPTVNPKTSYKAITDAKNLVLYVDELMNLANDTKYNIAFSTTLALTNYKTESNYSVNTREISGNFYIDKVDNKFNFKLDCFMKEISSKYENGVLTKKTAIEHNINFTIVNDFIYCTYYSDKGNDANKIKLKMDLNTLMTVIKTVGNMFNVSIPFIDNIDSLDTSILDQVLPSVDYTEIDVTYYLKDIFTTSTSLGIVLNKEALGADNDLTITINRDLGKISSISLSDLVITSKASKTNLFGTTFSIKDNNYSNISVPTDSNKYDDFSNVDDFLSSILETAKIKDTGFHIEGTAKLDINIPGLDIIASWICNIPDLDLTIDVSVDKNGSPIIYVKISNIQKLIINVLLTKFSIFESDTTSEIYIKDGYVYTIRQTNKKECRMMTLDYFSENALDQIIYLLSLGSTIEDAIRNTEPDTNYPRRFDTVYKSYSNNYDISLSGAHLAENNMIGDMNFKLEENEDKQLSNVSGDVSLVSNLFSFDLNLELKNIGNIVNVVVPEEAYTKFS